MASKLAEAALSDKFQVIFPGTCQKVAYTGTAGTITNAISSGVTVIQVTCTTAAYVKIGVNPTATTSDMYMPADTPMYFGVPGDGTYKVSAIQLSAGGTLHVCEGA